MATRIPPCSKRFTAALLAFMAMSVVVVAAPTGLQAAETPRRGGVLLAVIGADPPSLDPHQESTFANIQLVAPLYSTLLQIDPYNYPKIIGDVATEWKITPDGLTYTFKIRQGIRFHDGSPLTAADVKATYDKIVFPPEGVRSVRKNAYTAVARIEAPDPSTVVFKLKFPSASLLDNLASPWNVIFPKKYLDKDPNHFKTNVVGSGPFKLKSYTRGSTFEGERNPDYFVKDRPYLDGYKFFISPETSVRAAAIRSGRAYIEFRDLPIAEVDAIRKQLGDKVVVQTTAMVGQFGHRDQQHGEAVHRRPRPQGPHAGLRSLHGGQGAVDAHRPAGRRRADASGHGVGDAAGRASEAPGLLARMPRRTGPRPRGSWPRPVTQRLQGRPEEPQREAPYQDFAVYVIQEWRKIGIEAENRPLETAAWFADGRDTGNFELIIAAHRRVHGRPRSVPRAATSRGAPRTGAASPTPRSTTCSRGRRGRSTPRSGRSSIIELQKIVLENAYYMPGLWWTRNVVHWAKVKNYVAPPSHYTNQKLQDVWLAED